MKLGILGNGQLGRMAALAAARLGIDVAIYTPDLNGPANQVVSNSHFGAYDDEQALAAFTANVDAVTYEFENVPVTTARFIETLKPIFPQPIWLERAQHRLREKEFITAKGIDCAPYQAWDTSMSGKIADRDVIIKTCSGGYDGKGQWVVNKGEPYPSLPNVELIVEDKIDLAGEVSVIICADQHGHVSCYDPSWNEHEGGILRRSVVPLPLAAPAQAGVSGNMDPSRRWESECMQIAHKLIANEPFVGVLALELFITKEGKILANEMAPRPHNSGHWTIDACICSQFEQQVRAAMGMPLGSTKRHSDAEMINLIGDDVNNVEDCLSSPSTSVHLYGKTEVKSGRKMGHITRISEI